MNAEAILRMIVKQIFRRAVNKGVDAGLNRAFKGQNDGAQKARQAKQATRIARRSTRF